MCTPKYHNQNTLLLGRQEYASAGLPFFFSTHFPSCVKCLSHLSYFIIAGLSKLILSIGSLEQPLLPSVVSTWLWHIRHSGWCYPHLGQAVDRGGSARCTGKSYWGAVLLSLSLAYGKWWMSWMCYGFCLCWDWYSGSHDAHCVEQAVLELTAPPASPSRVLSMNGFLFNWQTRYPRILWFNSVSSQI